MRRRLPLFSALLCACVAYRPHPVDPAAEVRALAEPPPGPLAWEEAVRFALEHNPDLLALRARAAAAGPRPPPEPVGVAAGANEEHRFEAGLTLDALSLLGLGPRRAAIVLARARTHEAWMAHHEKARAVAGEIAEEYAVAEALAALPPLPTPVDSSVYVRAGLLPAASEAAARAHALELAAEEQARATDRAQSLVALRRLLGAPPGAAVEPGSSPAPLPGDAAPEALLAARADLQPRLAAFETADAAFRHAVARQYPGIVVEPSLGGDPRQLFGLVGVRLPFGAGSEARAAHAAREAAREEVRATALDALAEAERARLEAERAAARLAAARERFKAAGELFRAAQGRLATETGATGEFVLEGQARVGAARELREAALAEARARVSAARAAGWPAAPQAQ
ncbi:MAG: TolC family protein [Planctomycetaceae bacterium]